MFLNSFIKLGHLLRRKGYVHDSKSVMVDQPNKHLFILDMSDVLFSPTLGGKDIPLA